MLEHHKAIEEPGQDDSDADAFAVLSLLLIVAGALAFYLNG